MIQLTLQRFHYFGLVQLINNVHLPDHFCSGGIHIVSKNFPMYKTCYPRYMQFQFQIKLIQKEKGGHTELVQTTKFISTITFMRQSTIATRKYIVINQLAKTTYYVTTHCVMSTSEFTNTMIPGNTLIMLTTDQI